LKHGQLAELDSNVPEIASDTLDGRAFLNMRSSLDGLILYNVAMEDLAAIFERDPSESGLKDISWPEEDASVAGNCL
jgi:hypothetical protein